MAKGSSSTQDYKVPGLERGLSILMLFNAQTRELTAADIAKKLGLPRSTVYRLVVTLEQMGFLEPAETEHRYRLGRGVLRLGFEYLSALELVDLCQPIISRLSANTLYPSNLAILDEKEVVYVARAVVPNSLTGAMNIGSRLPAYATTVGRLLLSELSLEELNALYPEGELSASSVNTPSNIDALFEVIQQDKAMQCIVGEGYFEDGYSSVAAPVFDKRGKIIAVITVIVPSSSLTAAQVSFLTKEVQTSAEELTKEVRTKTLA